MVQMKLANVRELLPDVLGPRSLEAESISKAETAWDKSCARQTGQLMGTGAGYAAGCGRCQSRTLYHNVSTETAREHMATGVHTLILVATWPIPQWDGLVRFRFCVGVELGVKDLCAPDRSSVTVVKGSYNEPRPARCSRKFFKALSNDEFCSWAWQEVCVHLKVSVANARLPRHRGGFLRKVAQMAGTTRW